MSKKIIAITGCAAGIAHTYMAAEAIEKAAKELGYEAKVETHGSIGVENEFTAKDILDADVVIIACDIDVDLSRFSGKLLYQTYPKAAIHDGKKLIETAFAEGKNYKETASMGGMEIGTSSNSFMKAMMNGVSYLIPLAIVGGLAIAFANLNAMHVDPATGQVTAWYFDEDAVGYFFSHMFDAGKAAFLLMIPIFAAFTAMAIGGKPAFAPALLGAYLINDPKFLGTEAGAGFLGAILIGAFVGYLVKWMLKVIKLPAVLKPLIPIFIIPLVASFITFIFVLYVIGQPIAALMSGLYGWLEWLVAAYPNSVVLIGFVFGALMGTDLGGPINKTAMLVAGAIFMDSMARATASGDMTMVNLMPQTATTAAIAIAPIGAAMATRLYPKYYTKEERVLGVSSFIMGSMGITEGAIPFAISNPKAHIPAFIIGSGVAGALVSFLGLQIWGGIGSWTAATGLGYVDALPGSISFAHPGIWWIFSIFFASFVCALIIGLMHKFFSQHRIITEQ